MKYHSCCLLFVVDHGFKGLARGEMALIALRDADPRHDRVVRQAAQVAGEALAGPFDVGLLLRPGVKKCLPRGALRKKAPVFLPAEDMPSQLLCVDLSHYLDIDADLAGRHRARDEIPRVADVEVDIRKMDQEGLLPPPFPRHRRIFGDARGLKKGVGQEFSSSPAHVPGFSSDGRLQAQQVDVGLPRALRLLMFYRCVQQISLSSFVIL